MGTLPCVVPQRLIMPHGPVGGARWGPIEYSCHRVAHWGPIEYSCHPVYIISPVNLSTEKKNYVWSGTLGPCAMLLVVTAQVFVQDAGPQTFWRAVSMLATRAQS